MPYTHLKWIGTIISALDGRTDAPTSLQKAQLSGNNYIYCSNCKNLLFYHNSDFCCYTTKCYIESKNKEKQQEIENRKKEKKKQQ